ncbi:DnaB-like helicase C-terminal domain-containing protein [Psychrobacillus sp. PGGUH221]|uniref:DnaB-like helicase C-terminal domain-containing protein n=1 Tax=Psychrobacillus sp. PGGUH221 TaxID=3020058 RepID=UPI0035C7695C
MLNTVKNEQKLASETNENVQQSSTKGHRFPPLINYLREIYNKKLKEEKSAKTGLPNLDVILENGYSPGLHVIAGMPNIGKRSLLIHMTEEFTKQKFAVIMISSKETKTSIVQRFIARTTYKNDPANAIRLNQVPNQLSSDPLKYKQLLNQVAPTIKFISLTETPMLDMYSLEDKIRQQKEAYSQSVILIDLHEFSSWNKDESLLNEKIDTIRQIAVKLQIPILLTFDLNPNDVQNQLKGYSTSAGIERHVTTFSFLHSAIPPQPEQTPKNQSTTSQNELLRLQLKNARIGGNHQIYFTHRIDYGYFQEG